MELVRFPRLLLPLDRAQGAGGGQGQHVFLVHDGGIGVTPGKDIARLEDVNAFQSAVAVPGDVLQEAAE